MLGTTLQRGPALRLGQADWEPEDPGHPHEQDGRRQRAHAGPPAARLWTLGARIAGRSDDIQARPF